MKTGSFRHLLRNLRRKEYKKIMVPDEKVIIGTIRAGKGLQCILFADHSWRVMFWDERSKTMEFVLADHYEDSTWWGPEAGQPGVAVLADLAKQISAAGTMDVRVEMVDRPEEPPGTIY